MGETPSLLVWCCFFSLVYTDTTPEVSCCQRKVITAPSEYEGTYIFSRKFDGKKDSNCADACIYSKEGSPGEEFCFKAVSSGEATIDDQCDATPGPSSTGGSTSPGTTLDPASQIEKANQEIAKKNEEIAAKSTQKKAASDATNAVDNISSALSSSKVQRKKRSEATTLAPISSCQDFDDNYNLLLDTLDGMVDDDIPLIIALVSVLNVQLPDVSVCGKAQKEALKNKTSNKVQRAKAAASSYTNKKDDEINQLVKEVQQAQELITQANAALAASGQSTIPAHTLPDSLITQPLGGSTQSSTNSGGLTSLASMQSSPLSGRPTLTTFPSHTTSTGRTTPTIQTGRPTFSSSTGVHFYSTLTGRPTSPSTNTGRPTNHTTHAGRPTGTTFGHSTHLSTSRPHLSTSPKPVLSTRRSTFRSLMRFGLPQQLKDQIQQK